MQGTRELSKNYYRQTISKVPKTFLTNESYMNDYSEEIKAEVNNQYVDALTCIAIKYRKFTVLEDEESKSLQN